MAAFTIEQIAAAINFGLIFGMSHRRASGKIFGTDISFIAVQLTLPLLQVLLLVGFLRSESTAATWCVPLTHLINTFSWLGANLPALRRSVASRFIQSSLWPSILSCDTSAGRRDGVQSRVNASTYLATFAGALIIVAGILTPIGLGETIVAGAFVTAKFEYAVDPTPFGSETPSRDLYTLSRICGDGHIPCLGVNPSDFVTIQDQYNPRNETLFDTYVLPNITDCFASVSKA
jgi:hypothetical protein